jgi:MFS transporter, DHA1 family, multidrug resistance protein
VRTLIRDPAVSSAVPDTGECRLRVGAGEKEKGLEEGNASCETFREDLVTAKLHPELRVKTDPYLVDWDGPNDPDNPRYVSITKFPLQRLTLTDYRNWSLFKRSFVAFSISLLTFSGEPGPHIVRLVQITHVCTVYIGSAIYTSSIPSLIHDFGVSQTKATLGLTLYVLAYGIGPMFLTPLQEMPSIGRTPVYIIGLATFVILNVPIVTAKNFSTILAFRFWTGFAASPALATGVGLFVIGFRVVC